MFFRTRVDHLNEQLPVWFQSVKGGRGAVVAHVDPEPQIAMQPLCYRLSVAFFQRAGRSCPDCRDDGAAKPAGGAHLLRSHQRRFQRVAAGRAQPADAWVLNVLNQHTHKQDVLLWNSSTHRRNNLLSMGRCECQRYVLFLLVWSEHPLSVYVSHCGYILLCSASDLRDNMTRHSDTALWWPYGW